jgi:hypothetical protein
MATSARLPASALLLLELAAATVALAQAPRRPIRRQPVTPELERTAFADARARTLLERARAARLAQDSALRAYELGRVLAARPALFYDIGWAGRRADVADPGRPLSGAGAGLSLLDGLLRVDVARGIWPERRWRADLYLEVRF